MSFKMRVRSNSQFKAFDYNGSPKSKEEVLENQVKGLKEADGLNR